MAVDTAAKRAAAITAFQSEFGMHLPSSGGIDSSVERAVVAMVYGIEAAAGAAAVVDRRRRSVVAPWGVPYPGPAWGVPR